MVAPSRELAMQIVRVGQAILPNEARGCVQQAIGGANPKRQVCDPQLPPRIASKPLRHKGKQKCSWRQEMVQHATFGQTSCCCSMTRAECQHALSAMLSGHGRHP